MTIWLRAWGEPAAAPPPEAGGGPWDAILCNCWCRGVGGEVRIIESGRELRELEMRRAVQREVTRLGTECACQCHVPKTQGHATGRESGDFELRGNADQAGL